MLSFLLTTHVTCVVISIVLFLWRGIAMWIERPLVNRIYRRTLPDSIDTLLLGSGVAMAMILDYSLLEDGWLTAKIIGLLIYIILGAFALKYAKNKHLKRLCFIAALCMFGYIVSVAHTSQAVPF